MAESAAPAGKVFISYSRKDKDFVRRLHEALNANGMNAWVDWEGIPLSADWMAEITTAIQSADAFLFIISPDSLNSKVCGDELGLGLRYNKKLIPILYRPPEKEQAMHEKIAATNWVYMRAEDNFDATVPKLLEAISTDLDWLRQHTRLLQRALEWDSKARDHSFLLQGTDLDDAERWLSEANLKADREALPIHVEYIRAGREQARRRQRIAMVAISTALVVSLILAVLAVVQSVRATQNAILAANSAATAVASEQLARQNERLALAQRGAAQAKLVQQQPAALYESTLIAIHSISLAPSSEAEEVLRQNLGLMPAPVATMQQRNMPTWAVFSPDGDLALTSGGDRAAHLWDAHSGAEIAALAQEDEATIGFFTPDGKRIVTGGQEGWVTIWQIDGSEVRRVAAPADIPPEQRTITALALSPDSQSAAMGYANGDVGVLNLSSGEIVQTLHNYSFLYALVYSPDGQFLAAATQDGHVRIWQPLSGVLQAMVIHGDEVYWAIFSADSQRLATASRDQTSKVVDIFSRRVLGEFRHDDWVEDVDFNPNGRTVVTASDDNTVRVWNVASGREVLRLRQNGFVLYVTYSPNGKWIASGSADNTARIWDAVSGQEMARIPLDGKSGPLSFSPDSRRLITSNENGVIHIWDLSYLDALLTHVVQDQLIRSIHFTYDGQWLITGADDGIVRAWDAAGIFARVASVTTRTLYKIQSGFIRNITTSPTRNQVAMVSDYKVALIDLDNDQVIETDETAHFTRAAFSKNGAWLAVSTMEGLVNLLDASSGKRLMQFAHPTPVYMAGFNAANTYLAVGGQDAIWLWDINRQISVTTVTQPGRILDISFSRDQRWIASASSSGSIIIWQVAGLEGSHPTMTQKFELMEDSAVNDLDFNRDSTLLATGSENGLVRLWNMNDGRETARLAHPLAVKRVTYSSDGQYLVIASGRLVFVWQAAAIKTFNSSDLLTAACSHLIRNLTTEEWKDLGLVEQYHPLCPNLP